MKRKKLFMGIDQYGQTYHGLTHPRKDLLNKLCRARAQKMYVDKKDGSAFFCGYIIAGLWIQLYQVIPFEKKA